MHIRKVQYTDKNKRDCFLLQTNAVTGVPGFPTHTWLRHFLSVFLNLPFLRGNVVVDHYKIPENTIFYNSIYIQNSYRLNLYVNLKISYNYMLYGL